MFSPDPDDDGPLDFEDDEGWFLFLLHNWQIIRAHHASAHDGLSANGLPDICLIFLNDSKLSCLK